MSLSLVNRKSKIVNGDWLPDMDLNHDKQIQSLLCYRYTIGQRRLTMGESNEIGPGVKRMRNLPESRSKNMGVQVNLPGRRQSRLELR